MNNDSNELLTLLEPFTAEPDSHTVLPPESAALLGFVEKIVRNGSEQAIDAEAWHTYLNYSGRPKFLLSLGSAERRNVWAESMFRIVESSGYSLQTMFGQRVAEHPQKTYLHESVNAAPSIWSYSRTYSYVRRIAASFCQVTERPRVLIYLENSAQGACADLACLTFGIFVSPLNVHFDAETLAWIINRLNFTIAVTDTEERYHRLMEAQKAAGIQLRTFVTDQKNQALRDTDFYLGEACSHLSDDETEKLVSARPDTQVHSVVTTMFTSGSTGRPKGVSFSGYNLVTKRLARAAALPRVGGDEVLLCYLPLFHTFGRYLELMGMLYWHGTYVFAGNPSSETLFRRLGEIRPTGLIGIPLRWQQIRDRCLELSGVATSDEQQSVVLRQIVGDRLRWGLSAAGYLDPKVFRFFHRYGVALCSGFGMTEATGGVTMTPPEDYRDNSVGLPLPGIETRFSDVGELQIKGPYIARYLDDLEETDGTWSFDGHREDYWLPTGDLFVVREDGHYEIVDRIKDIYKNNRGQTVAPRHVEQKFDNVPGFKRTFLVGDGRDYNVLLIVPDTDEELLVEAADSGEVLTYFNKIVTSANLELAPYERVVNIAVLERDFDIAYDELTPKGSYKRKHIEKNFAATIDELYVRKHIELQTAGCSVHLPRWFFRDLGILESDIEADEDGLYNRNTNKRLRLRYIPKHRTFLIGDIEYTIKENKIDMGLFSRQPLLWAGNPSLIDFCLCKEGWDVPLGPVSEQVFLPYRSEDSVPVSESSNLGHIRNQHLQWVHTLSVQALFGPLKEATTAVGQLETVLESADDRIAAIVRMRLEALARHPVEDIRCWAYSILLLDKPLPDYSKVFPAFVQSGLSFLNAEFIHKLTHRKIEKRRLEALRRRMNNYRKQLQWPSTPVVREQFINLFRLIADFARKQPEFYDSVRAELASWILHKTDPQLMRAAEEILRELVDSFERELNERTNVYTPEEWKKRIVFDTGVSEFEADRLRNVLVCTTFLHQSLILAFDCKSFDLMDVPPGGIWISRNLSMRQDHRYRMSINTTDGDHYDLLLSLREDFQQESVMQVVYWLIAIAGYPYGPAPLPRFGCCRPELGALSVVFISDLTVWERIREYNSTRSFAFAKPRKNFLRKLFTRAMSAYFAGFRNSGYKIIPGFVSPVNIVVPEPDFRQGATILSLAGWRHYEGPLSLLRPLIKTFFDRTKAHYPWSSKTLRYSWIFDACMEELGRADCADFLQGLLTELQTGAGTPAEEALEEETKTYLSALEDRYHVPLALENAVFRYNEWQEATPDATVEAKEEMIGELYRLYRVDRFDDIARYFLFRRTYFADAAQDVRDCFDYLLLVMYKNPESSATSLIELSDLQSTLVKAEDRRIFSKLVFPRTKKAPMLEIKAVGDAETKQVVVQSEITDRNGAVYYVKEAIEPSEIGQLYRMFISQHYPKTISEQDQFFVAQDSQERIVGGICFQMLENDIVHLDGLTIAQPLKSKGLGTAILEDFCIRMTNRNIKVVKTHFFMREFYLKRSFAVDKRWGGLVRFLGDYEPEVPDMHGITVDAEGASLVQKKEGE